MELVAVTGKWKGNSWPVEAAPLVLGRGDNTDIQIPHRTVSRRHCQLSREGDAVVFEDLGSQNPALINGVPVRKCLMHVGDELAVGPASFLLSYSAYGGDMAANTKRDAETTPWGEDSMASDAVESRSSDKLNRPRTVDDLALLHDLTHEFGACSKMEGLYEVLRRRLYERFSPCVAWLARVQFDQELALCAWEAPDEISMPKPPLKIMDRVLAECRAAAAHLEGPGQRPATRTLILAAPVAFAGVHLGVLAVQPLEYLGERQESDLVMLTLFAKTLAPYLYALEELDQLRRDVERLRVRAGESAALVGESREMGHIRSQIVKAARTDLPVLILGETGTGKELAARMILAKSARRSKPFVVVNCAAIPRDLFEGELFGHEKGAYTGATDASPGLLAQADGGTLFLDEIGDLSLDNQARILRFIEYGTFRRIGAAAETRVDVRIVAATNKDIAAAIRNDAFREDLYHRLNGFEICIPPLRKRAKDIPVLANYFFELAKSDARHPLTGIAPETMEYLCACSWPGNVRQLRSRILRAVAVAREALILPSDVFSHDDNAPERDLEASSLTLQEMEHRHIETVLSLCGGDIQKSAKVLQIGRSTLYRKIEEYGIRVQ